MFLPRSIQSSGSAYIKLCSMNRGLSDCSCKKPLGLYRSDNRGDSWQDSPGRFGSTMANAATSIRTAYDVVHSIANIHIRGLYLPRECPATNHHGYRNVIAPVVLQEHRQAAIHGAQFYVRTARTWIFSAGTSRVPIVTGQPCASPILVR